MDANIFHLKSSDSHKPNYFQTSTPLEHIPIPMTVMVDLLHAVGCWDGEILISSLC